MRRRSRAYIDDPDDNRRRFTRVQKLFIGLGIFVGSIVAFFAWANVPSVLYPLLVPVVAIPFFWNDRRGRTERERIAGYLKRIPPAERMERAKCWAKLDLPAAQLDAVAARFPELAIGDVLESEQIYRLVLCWYYSVIKGHDDTRVRRLVFGPGSRLPGAAVS